LAGNLKGKLGSFLSLGDKMDKIVKLIKKKKADTESVIKQVVGGVQSDWYKLLDALETDPSKKRNIAKPGK